MGDRLRAEEVEGRRSPGDKALSPLVRGGTGKARLEVHKDRPGHLQRPSPGTFVIASDEHGCSWRIDHDQSRDAEGEFRPTGYMEKVSKYLERQLEPPSRNQIEKDVPGKAEYIRAATDRLIAEGYARELEGKNRARLVQFIRAFREEDEAA